MEKFKISLVLGAVLVPFCIAIATDGQDGSGASAADGQNGSDASAQSIEQLLGDNNAVINSVVIPTTNLDRSGNSAPLVVVGNGAGRNITFDFTGDTISAAPTDSNKSIYISGAAQNAIYSIYNLNGGTNNNIPTGINTSRTNAPSPHGTKTIDHNNSILGVLANAGIIFNNMDANYTAYSQNDQIDNGFPAVTTGTNIADALKASVTGTTLNPGTTFVLRGTSVDGNLTSGGYSLDLAFDMSDERPDSAIQIAKSSFQGTDINLTDSPYAAHKLSFKGAGAINSNGLTLSFASCFPTGNSAANGRCTSNAGSVDLTLEDLDAPVTINMPGVASGTGVNNTAAQRVANRLASGSNIKIINTTFNGNILTNNGFSSAANINSTSSNIIIHETNGKTATIGMVHNGYSNYPNNYISLRFLGENTLDSNIADLNHTRFGDYGSLINTDLGDKNVTAIAQQIGTAIPTSLQKNTIELKTKNSGGVIEFVREHMRTGNDQNTNVSPKFGRLTEYRSAIDGVDNLDATSSVPRMSDVSNIDLWGTSLVGDVVVDPGAYMKMVFASGTGADAVNNATDNNKIADSKYYGGIITLSANNGAHGKDEFAYGDKQSQGLYFIGDNSHNFKNGMVDENNTIIAAGASATEGKDGFGKVHFTNAGDVDSKLFSSWSTLNAQDAKNSNKYFLEGTSITGDINATEKINTRGNTATSGNARNQFTYKSEHNATHANPAWELTATFDKTSNRGSSDAFGLLDSNLINIADSNFSGNLHMLYAFDSQGNSLSNQVAKLTFKGAGSHAFTESGGKSIKGGAVSLRWAKLEVEKDEFGRRVGDLKYVDAAPDEEGAVQVIDTTKPYSQYIFDNAFANGEFSITPFLSTNGKVVIANSNINARIHTGNIGGATSIADFNPGRGEFELYFYGRGNEEYAGEATQYVENRLLNEYGIVLDKSKDSTFTGTLPASGAIIHTYFVGNVDLENLVGSLITDEDATFVTAKNPNNTYTLVDVGRQDLSAIATQYTNIRGDIVGYGRSSGGRLNINPNDVFLMGNSELYFGRSHYAVENSGYSVVGDHLYYSGNILESRPDEMSNSLDFLHFVNYFDNHKEARHDITFDFVGATRWYGWQDGEVKKIEKMGGAIQGAGRDDTGKASRYVFTNMGLSAPMDLNRSMSITEFDEVSDFKATSDNRGSVEFTDSFADGASTNLKKTLTAQNMSSLQAALIKNGVKFYVDGNEKDHEGTIIGIRGVGINLEEGYNLNNAADNKFGYDLEFSNSNRLNGELDFSANNNDISLRFEGESSFAQNEFNFGNGSNQIAIKNARRDFVVNAPDSNVSSAFEFENVKSAMVDARNAKKDSTFVFKNIEGNSSLMAENAGSGAKVEIKNAKNLNINISNIGGGAEVEIADSLLHNTSQNGKFLHLGADGAGGKMLVSNTDIINRQDGQSLRGIEALNAGDIVEVSGSRIEVGVIDSNLTHRFFDARGIDVKGSLSVKDASILVSSGGDGRGISIEGIDGAESWEGDLVVTNTDIKVAERYFDRDENPSAVFATGGMYGIKSTAQGSVVLDNVSIDLQSEVYSSTKAAGVSLSEAQNAITDAAPTSVVANIKSINIKKPGAEITGFELKGYAGAGDININSINADGAFLESGPIYVGAKYTKGVDYSADSKSDEVHNFNIGAVSVRGQRVVGLDIAGLHQGAVNIKSINTINMDDTAGTSFGARISTRLKRDSAFEQDSAQDKVIVTNFGEINAQNGLELSAGLRHDLTLNGVYDRSVYSLVKLENLGRINAIEREVIAKGRGMVEIGTYTTALKDFRVDANRPFEIGITESSGYYGNTASGYQTRVLLNGNIMFDRIEFEGDSFNVQDMVSVKGEAAELIDAEDNSLENAIKSGVVIGENLKFTSAVGDLVNFNLDKENGVVRMNVNMENTPVVTMSKVAFATMDAQSSKISSEVSNHISSMLAQGVGNSNRSNRLKERLVATETIQMDVPIALLSVKSKNRTETFLSPYYSRSKLSAGNMNGTSDGTGFMAGITHGFGEDGDYLLGIHAGLETRSGTSSVGAQSNSSNMNSVIVGLHGRARLAKLGDDVVFVRGEVNYISGKAKQRVSQGRAVESSASTRSVGGSILAGYDKSLGEDKVLSVEVGGLFQQSQMGQTSMDLGALFNADSIKKTSTYGLANLRYSQSFEMNSLRLVPTISGGVKALLGSREYDVMAISSSRAYKANELVDRYSGVFSVGFGLSDLSDVFRFFLLYTGEFGNFMSTHTINGRVGIKF